MAKYTILLIDYEPRSIERLRTPLEKAGYRVDVATDGKAGIIKFHHLKPAAVIIEAMLPKRHGFEVCQELKQTPHGDCCPIMIATSVYRGRKYRHQAMHLYGCDAYLEKPLTDDELLATVGSALAAYETKRKDAPDEPLELKVDESFSLPTRAPLPSNGNAKGARLGRAIPADEEIEIEIIDRLDDLLSDDPSKSSPGGSGS